MNTRLAKIIFGIKSASGANGILYFLQKIPLVKRLIPDKIYADLGTKTFVTGFFQVLGILFGIAKKLLYLFFLLFVTYMYGNMANEHMQFHFGAQFAAFRHVFFCLSCVAMFLTESTILSATREKYIAIRQMRVEPKEYVAATFPLQKAIFLASYLFPLLFVAHICGGTIGDGFLLFLTLAAFRIGGEALQLACMRHLNKALNLKTYYVVAVYFLLMVLALVPVAMENRGMALIAPVYHFLYGPAGILCQALLLLAGLFYIRFGYKDQDWNRSILQNLKLEYLIGSGKNTATAAFRDVQMKDDDIEVDADKLKRIQKKQGYEYLNALFFARHRRVLFKPVLTRLAAIGMVAALFALMITKKTFDLQPREITEMTPIMVFLMYLLSVAGKATKAMFYNCDNSMLKFAFYREPKTILRNFGIRLRRIAAYNLLIGAAVCTAIMLVVALSGGQIFTTALIAMYLTILLLAVFFTVHYMFLYYVLQPYTSDLTIKSPVYSAVNYIVYFLCLICLQIEHAGLIFMFGVIGATLLYCIVALLLVYRLAPRLFRVK